jgi:PAS domain S-box-containing protein
MRSSDFCEESGGVRSGAILAGQTRLLEMIATGAPLAQVLNELVQLIEFQSEGLLCSVLLLDGEGRLHHGAAPSLPESYNKAADGILVGPTAGSCGTAAYRRESVVVTDILEDPLWNDYRELAIGHGLRACWSTPFLSRRGSVLGTFAMYYRTPRAPLTAEIRLIDVATRIASIAVERWQSDEELRQAAGGYRALVENLNDIVFRVDLQGIVSYISPPVRRHSGFSPEEIIGRPFTTFVHPEDLAALQRSFAETLAGHISPVEFRVLDKQGGVHWCRSSSRPQFLRDKLVGATGVIVDITEQKQTADALQKAEEKYRSIFEEAVVGIFQSEPGGRCLTANPALARMFGYDSPQEFIATTADLSRIYVNPENQSEILRLLETDGSISNFVVQVYRRDGYQ